MKWSGYPNLRRRPPAPSIGMTFCFVVGVFWLYEDLKDLLRTR
jgi:hypothetical protein